LWSNAFIDENAIIDSIVNAITHVEIVAHILKQGTGEVSPSFETFGQAIMNISKDISVVAWKLQMEKCKKPEAKTNKKAIVKKKFKSWC
jgi:hypothetical protein